ncbi:outer membrane protein OmpA-like peptidoglycan-associated protein [Rubricella aquisinus]|uniref:Outer membrane protein OmpA-like peptidoglycan-associated protein n=1 Tax=Rubricella aquisinus TaxID=2028108 RepID=A0A840WMX1_9RHOB|nr:OmpA family protein [Rubricella aquisinus]MBB5515931.1 outer membrane protein OmpA-like peptidoglycan-associated protein [Rubricella aquisinus]
MSLSKRHLPALIAIVALSACSANEIGSNPDNPSFGTATAQNRIAQKSSLSQGQRAINLARAFNEAVPNTVTFDFNSTTLGPEARQTLDLQANWLRRNTGTQFEIVGHADLVGGEAVNQRIGLERATAALEYLVAQGVPRERLIALASLGEEQPVVQTEERERLNRRAVTQVSGTQIIGDGRGFDGQVALRIYSDYIAGTGPVLTVPEDSVGNLGTSDE